MALYTIGDLHLSFGEDKPMAVFGAHWEAHFDKIKRDWEARVSKADTVILAGDTSWAMKFEHAGPDLGWIDALPGRKILFKGNHDYWWTSKGKMDGVYPSLFFVYNGFDTYGDMAICGTRGWECPDGAEEAWRLEAVKALTSEDLKGMKDDDKIYRREVLRLELSLSAAVRAGYKRILGVLHYPPVREGERPSAFTDLFERYGVEQVIYGHLHGAPAFERAFNGIFQGIPYQLVSCDFLDFKLKWLME